MPKKTAQERAGGKKGFSKFLHFGFSFSSQEPSLNDLFVKTYTVPVMIKKQQEKTKQVLKGVKTNIVVLLENEKRKATNSARTSNKRDSINIINANRTT